LRAVTTGPDIDSEPDWSPNGQRLVFVRKTSQDQDVWSASAGGTDVRRVTEVHAGHDRCRVLLAFSPAWSPDGSEIAYSLLDGGNLSCALHGTWQSIEAVATDGSGRTRRITDGGRTDPISGEGAYEPTWSPDGTMVAFADVLGEKSRIAVVPRAGGRFRFVTPRSYEAFNPDWRP
jgi:TolB protein